MNKIIIEYLKEKKLAFKENGSLKEYTAFKIGGTAELLVMPEDPGCLAELFGVIKENKIDYYILGNGSNVLIAEKYFNGVFVVLSRMNSYIEVCGGEFICAHSGVDLSAAASAALESGLSGLEFAYGIPGTLGGAVVMNAGAYGGAMSDIVYSSEYLDIDTLEVKAIGSAEHRFGYRRSIFDENKLILSCCLKLQPGNKHEISAEMQKNIRSRKDKQPLNYPSAGSVFKRGENYFAAKLIEDCGLKGAVCGGAQVSEKHAGFIINKANAGFSDVAGLIEHIKTEVFKKTGIELECEIKIID